MKATILIVTFRRDFPYLEWCLKSIRKFCTGFFQVLLLVPTPDIAETVRLLREHGGPPSDGFLAFPYDEFPGKGMLHHMLQIMNADQWCPTADFILHMDSDCTFTEPVTPETYIVGGKPILRYEPFSMLGLRHPEIMPWFHVTQACLPFEVKFETMRCHPGVFHRGLYSKARSLVATKTGRSCDVHILSQGIHYPEGFCEFVTLGNVAMRFFPERYLCVKQTSDITTPYNKMRQAYSRRPITPEDREAYRLAGL